MPREPMTINRRAAPRQFPDRRSRVAERGDDGRRLRIDSQRARDEAAKLLVGLCRERPNIVRGSGRGSTEQWIVREKDGQGAVAAPRQLPGVAQRRPRAFGEIDRTQNRRNMLSPYYGAPVDRGDDRSQAGLIAVRTCATASAGTAFTGSRTVRTGHGAVRTTRSATLSNTMNE